VAVFGTTGKQAAFLNAAFWGSFAFGRAVAVLCALYLSPSVMLLFDLVCEHSPHSSRRFFIGSFCKKKSGKSEIKSKRDLYKS
jgi:hypothetical protein